MSSYERRFVAAFFVDIFPPAITSLGEIRGERRSLSLSPVIDALDEVPIDGETLLASNI